MRNEIPFDRIRITRKQKQVSIQGDIVIVTNANGSSDAQIWRHTTTTRGTDGSVDCQKLKGKTASSQRKITGKHDECAIVNSDAHDETTGG